MTNDLGAASCNATETIEHLDFEPACDSLLHCDGAPHADWIVFTTIPPCGCVPGVRTWCSPCLAMAHGQTNCNLKCIRCGNSWQTPGWIIRAEPLR